MHVKITDAQRTDGIGSTSFIPALMMTSFLSRRRRERVTSYFGRGESGRFRAYTINSSLVPRLLPVFLQGRSLGTRLINIAHPVKCAGEA